MSAAIFKCVKCTIQSGAFSGEWVFTVRLADGETLKSVASKRYLFDDKRKPLRDNVPAPGKSIEGFVFCRFIEKGEAGNSVVEVPSAELIYVADKDLVDATWPPQEVQNVSVGSRSGVGG